MPAWKKVITSGSSATLNQLSVSTTVTASAFSASAGFTGSLLGTASYVTGSVYGSTNPATSASYAVTASYSLTGFSGTGTTNNIAKFTAASTLGNSNIFDDGTNIQITGSTTISSSLVLTGSLSIFRTLKTSASINGGFNVGIGYDSPNSREVIPAARLHILDTGAPSSTYAGASSTTLAVQNSNNSGATAKISVIAGSAGNAGIWLVPSSSIPVGGLEYDGSTNKLRIYTGTGYKHNIDNSGRFGILTLSPSYSLDVTGDGNFSANLTVSGSNRVTGSLTITGSVSATQGGFTGSISASFLQGAITNAQDRKSTRLNSSHTDISRMPSSA